MDVKLRAELPQEVLDKIENTESLPLMIKSHELEDLRYIPIPSAWRRFIKRMADILISLLAMVLLLMPMLVIAVAIYIDDPGAILFHQKRVGRGGKRFRFYKFRTMREGTPKYLSTMELEHPELYITRLGQFLRRYSLDELPQLFNVLRGDMSLVGPRPLISDEYEVHEMRMRFGVYNIRPGITGLAQVNGRDLCSPGQKVRWDVKYVENYSLLLDGKILLATLPKVFGAEGVVEGFDSAGWGESADN